MSVTPTLTLCVADTVAVALFLDCLRASFGCLWRPRDPWLCSIRLSTQSHGKGLGPCLSDHLWLSRTRPTLVFSRCRSDRPSCAGQVGEMTHNLWHRCALLRTFEWPCTIYQMKLHCNTQDWGELFLFQQKETISNLVHGAAVIVSGLRDDSVWQLNCIAIVRDVHGYARRSDNSVRGKISASGKNCKIIMTLSKFITTGYFNTYCLWVKIFLRLYTTLAPLVVYILSVWGQEFFCIFIFLYLNWCATERYR